MFFGLEIIWNRIIIIWNRHCSGGTFSYFVFCWLYDYLKDQVDFEVLYQPLGYDALFIDYNDLVRSKLNNLLNLILLYFCESVNKFAIA